MVFRLALYQMKIQSFAYKVWERIVKEILDIKLCLNSAYHSQIDDQSVGNQMMVIRVEPSDDWVIRRNVVKKVVCQIFVWHCSELFI